MFHAQDVAPPGPPAGVRGVLEHAVRDQDVIDRYDSKVARLPGVGCWFFTGAIHPHGHGRFWVGTYRDAHGASRDAVVIAHRFAWALRHGIDALTAAPVLAHTCDEASCQNPDHPTVSSNAATWLFPDEGVASAGVAVPG